MNTRRLKLALILAAAGALAAPRAAADHFDDIMAQEIGSAIGRHIGGAIDAAAGMRQAAAQSSAEIAAARRAYWDAVRSGRGVEAAKARFQENLDVKDLYYLILSIPEGVDGPRPVVLNLISGNIDGGIQPSARGDFLAWIKAIRTNLGAEVMWWHRNNTFVIPTPAQLAEALKASEKQYQRYLRARDWAEIDRSGLTWPWDTDARAHAIMLLNRYGNWTGTNLKQRYEDLAAMFGEGELLAAADRVRQARRNSEAMLADPAAVGVTSPDPNYALLELLALKNGRTYLGYLLCNTGAWVVPNRTIPEARRELEAFVTAYGADAIDEVGSVIQQLPRLSTGQIAMWRVNRNDYPNVVPAANAIQAFWYTLELRHPSGRERAVFAFHPGVRGAEEADRLRAGLEKRYGRDAVADALRALLGQEPYVSMENQKRRGAFLAEFHREALEKRGLDPQRQRDHFYETDYTILVRLLEEGPRRVVGDPGPAATQEDFAISAIEQQYQEEWQRRGKMLEFRMNQLRDKVTSDAKTYPYSQQWLSHAMVSYQVWHYLNPAADPNDINAKWHPHKIAQAVRTLQIHCDLANDPGSVVSEYARAVEEAIAEVWPRVRADERYRGDEFEIGTRGGRPDRSGSQLNAIIGAWSGRLPRGQPLTVRLALPDKAGGPVGTAQYGNTTMHWYFLTRGYPTAIVDFPDGWRGYSFIQATAAAENRDKFIADPPFITVFLTDKGQLEVRYYQRRGSRYREMSRALLDRRDVGAPAGNRTTGTPTAVSPGIARSESRRAPAMRAAMAPATGTLKAESAIRYDGNTIQFTGGAAEVAELEAAANAGNTRACLLLGELVGQRAIAGGDAVAVQWFEMGHKLGDAECTARLALFLMTGRGVEENDPRREGQAIWRLAQHASSRRSALGNYVMAECYAKGIGVTPAEPVARAFYIQAAAAGHPLAQQWCEANSVSFTSAGGRPAGRVR